MTTRRRFLASLALPAMTVLAVALAGSSLAAPGDDKKPTAEIGKPAPDFVLKDTTGKEHRLSDYKGKIVVLQWINPDCPVCRRVMSGDVVTSMSKALKEADENVVHLTINSTKYMDAEPTAAYLKKHKKKMAGLVDQDGTVGRLYGARTTPHLFVIDAEGVLRYSGAIDDDRNGRKGKDATNYVVNAVHQIKAGETVSPDKTRPYGCGVKYKS